ncbi:MAG: arylesterase [Betaproteobacteria bacterium]|nr:MAG: arylesterase [Betaproteobacteria bacterium]
MCLASGAQAAPQHSIVVFGDSLSSAYGIARSRGWVALLAERLKRERLDYIVVNASISGDTSSGGLGRIRKTLQQNRPSVLILELGANDGLRGLPVAQMKSNLGRIIEQAQGAGARIVVVGMKLPPNYGPEYTRAFESAFGELARRYKAALVPFLLEDFAEKPDLFQADRIHPTEAAQPLMLERVWKALAPLLKKEK